MPYATTPDNVKLYYEEVGQGTPILFVHEFAGDHRSYEPQVRHFARRYRCIAYNARGYPPSDVPTGGEAYSQDRARDDIRAVLDALPGARLVGGCVRDALAGRPVADVDLATPDPPEEVARRLQGAGLRAVPTGLQHGTITAVSGHRGFEVTTLRRDVDTDGRHARVAWTEDWREDAARRDFTMNAMSMLPDGTVHDYFGGLDDLRAGRVRFVGEAAARIAEDYLRVLRFFRFHARYDRGVPDPSALAALRAGVPGLARLSPERVWSELKRILATPDPCGSIVLMGELGVLPALLPGAVPDGLLRLVASGAPADPLLRFAALCLGMAEAMAERLRMSAAERDRLLALSGPAPHPSMDDDALRRGKPTVRVAYDEATALLVGDTLQAQAFTVPAECATVPPARLLTMVRLLAQAAGSNGMCGGQAIDLDSVGLALTRDELERMALASDKVRRLLDGATPKKIVVVPGRLVNIVL